MISHSDKNIYDQFVVAINDKTEEEAIKHLSQLDNKTCNTIALILNEKKLSLIEVIYYSNKEKLLSEFIAKLSKDTCEKLCWPIPEEGGFFDLITEREQFREFAEKISHITLDKLVKYIGPHRKINEVCTLQIIAEEQPLEVFSWILNQVSYLTCYSLVPSFFNTLNVEFLPLENFNAFLKKTKGIIDNYFSPDSNDCKKCISYLSNHHEYFLTLLNYLRNDILIDILRNIPLSPEALVCVSFHNTFPTILKNNKTIGLKVLSNAMAHPEILKKIQPYAKQLESIEFWDGGESNDLWSATSQSLFSHAPMIKPRLNREDLLNTILKPDYTNFKDKNFWKDTTFLRTQGRTVLIQNKEGNIIAIKVKKKFELASELIKEYKTTSYLKQNAEKFNLRSLIPTPISVGDVRNILEFVKLHANENDFNQFASMVNDQETHPAYSYEINPKQCDYFTYLHDSRIANEVWIKTNRDIVHDLFHLLQKGIVFPQLADIFHNSEKGHENRYDKGRYIVLVNLLINGNYGGGRLTGWKKAVQYPNLRVSGLADLGDCISIRDSILGSGFNDKYYQFVFKEFGARGGNYLLGNLMAEYQYILFLIAGCRAANLTEIAVQQKSPENEIDLIWQKAASQVFSNCVQAASVLTQKSEETIEAYLSSMIDVSRLKRQMRYWMTTDYIQDVMNDNIRNDIYEPETKISISFKNFRVGTFSAKYGFCLNGTDQDLGAVNGQEPIKEMNNLIYRMVNYIFTSHHLLNETLCDLNKILKEKDIKKSEALRKKSFSFLPEIAQENIQFSLGKERLKQKNSLPDDIKSDIIAEQRKIAGNKIRRFWRTHQSVKQISTMSVRKYGIRTGQ